MAEFKVSASLGLTLWIEADDHDEAETIADESLQTLDMAMVQAWEAVYADVEEITPSS